jgi:hypothetical protein
VGSAILPGISVHELELFALHALASVPVDDVVEELMGLAQGTGMLDKVPEPWRALVLREGSPILRMIIGGIVRRIQRKLQAGEIAAPPAA